MLITMILVVLFMLALGGASLGRSKWGYLGFSPAGLILTVLLVMWATGYLHW